MKATHAQALVATVALAVLAASARRVGAEPARVGTWLSVYTSSDRLTVISPQATLRAPLRRDLDAHLGYEADVISAASVDVMTSASPRGYTEVRQAVTLGSTYRPRDGTTLNAQWMPSWEPDYASQTFTASALREWLDRRLTTQLGLRLGLDAVGRSGSARDTWRALDTYGVDVGVGYVFSPRTVGQLAYEGRLLDGYQASPYRFARVAFPGVDGRVGVPEAVPDRRARHALAIGLRHALTRRWFVATSARLYADSWGVASHTEELEVQRAFDGETLILGLSARVYGQSAASFYEPTYASNDGALPRWRTADKMLTRSWSALFGARASIGLVDLGSLSKLRLTGKLELYDQRFFDFAPLAWRRGLIASFGATGEF
jgi:hypothetical protein